LPTLTFMGRAWPKDVFLKRWRDRRPTIKPFWHSAFYMQCYNITQAFKVVWL